MSSWSDAVFRRALCHMGDMRNLPDFEDDEHQFEVPDDPTSHMLIGSEEWNQWHSNRDSQRRRAGTQSGFSKSAEGPGGAADAS